MGCDTYKITINTVTIARGLSLNHAAMFAKAIFEEYNNEKDLGVTIEREKKNEVDQYAD